MKVYVVISEAWYEGGGSYQGCAEIQKIFKDKKEAEEYKKSLTSNWTTYEIQEFVVE